MKWRTPVRKSSTGPPARSAAGQPLLEHEDRKVTQVTTPSAPEARQALTWRTPSPESPAKGYMKRRKLTEEAKKFVINMISRELETSPTVIAESGGASLEFSGGINVKHMPSEGKMRVPPGEIGAEDLQRVEQVMEKSNTNDSTVLSSVRAYVKFRKANPSLKAHGRALVCFGAQQTKVGGITPGSALNKLNNIVDYIRANGKGIGEWKLLKRFMSGLEIEQAMLGHSHAIDIDTDEEAFQYIRNIRAADVRAALWLMMTCGARVADLLRLQLEGQLAIDIKDARLHIEFRVTKNRRKTSEKFAVSFPFVQPPDDEVAEIIVNLFKAEEIPLPDVKRVLSVLKGMCKRENLFVGQKKCLTSYSFRRRFDHRIISWYTDDDGITEWLKVIEWTGHKETKALRGSYAKATKLSKPKGKMDKGKVDQAAHLPSDPTVPTDTHALSGTNSRGAAHTQKEAPPEHQTGTSDMTSAVRVVKRQLTLQEVSLRKQSKISNSQHENPSSEGQGVTSV